MLHPESIAKMTYILRLQLAHVVVWEPHVLGEPTGRLYTINTSGDDAVRTTSGRYLRLSRGECVTARVRPPSRRSPRGASLRASRTPPPKLRDPST
jgi:hypothetical protein